MRFMKKLLNFLSTSVIGGLLVVAPVVLLVFILGAVREIVVSLVAPVAGILPVERVGGEHVANVVATGLIVGFCFLVGLAARTAIGSRPGGWVEGAVLRRVPAYGLLKTLSRRSARSRSISLRFLLRAGGERPMRSRPGPTRSLESFDHLFASACVDQLVPGSVRRMPAGASRDAA